ncbi:hypothetical protein H0H93_005225, partial [Arthromyces matolae]
MSGHGERIEPKRPRQIEQPRSIQFVGQSDLEEQSQSEHHAVGHPDIGESSHPYRSSGTTEHATSIPSTSPISQQPADSSSVSSEAYIAEQSILKEVDTITTSFEKGKITKPDAIGKVITLAYRLKTSEVARQAAIIDFIGTIDRVEKRAVTLRDRGKQFETTKDREGHGQSTTVSSSKDRYEGPGDNESRLRSDSPVHRRHDGHDLHRGNENPRKRPYPSNSDNSSESGNSDNDESSNSRHKFDPTQLPWYNHDELVQHSSDPRCAQNRKFLSYYLRHSKHVKREAIASHIYPAGFPTSELDKLIRGEPADFNAILSAHHHLGAPKENRGSIGNRTIILGVSDPVRKVENSGNWLIAASSYSKVLTMFFPDRTEEFADHIEYILQLFAAKHESAHPRVIAFDLAIRTRVGAGTRMLLTDRD